MISIIDTTNAYVMRGSYHMRVCTRYHPPGDSNRLPRFAGEPLGSLTAAGVCAAQQGFAALLYRTPWHAAHPMPQARWLQRLSKLVHLETGPLRTVAKVIKVAETDFVGK